MTEKERLGMENLRAAMIEDNALLLQEYLPVEGEIHHSKEYLRRIKKLQGAHKKHRLNIFGSFGKRVAAAILLFIALGGGLMSVSAVRKPITAFFVSVREGIIELFCGEDESAPVTIENIYTLSYLPDDCAWLTQSLGEKEVSTTWTSDFVIVTLVQETLDSRLYVNNEFARFEIKEIMGKQMAVIERYDLRIYFWNTEDYAYQLIVQGVFWEEDCLRMLNSLVIDETKTIKNGE